MQVVDPATGEAVGSGKPGEIWLKSPLVMIGYAGNPTATAAIIDNDGWLHTGNYYAQFTPPQQAQQNSPACVVSVAWRCELDDCSDCSDFKFSVGDSLELSGIQFTSPKRTRHRQDSFAVSGLAVWIGF